MDIRFDDYNAYPDSDILEVTETGIMLSTGQFIDYAKFSADASTHCLCRSPTRAPSPAK